MYTEKNKPLIGFVGQGYVGGNYADNFEERGYSVVRYSLEPKYIANKDRIKECDIVFVCVPTPTTPKGFDSSIVEEGISLARPGAITVTKSTLLPGTTKKVQKKFKNRIVLCSPEFLSVATAAEDAAHPFSNIIGVPSGGSEYTRAAELVMSVLPDSPFSLICDSNEAEMIKYAHNANGYFQVILSNLLYDLAKAQKCDWDVIQSAIEHDPMISNRYAKPIHQSGRGAGGLCFIKDFAALRKLYTALVPKDAEGAAVLRSLEKKNTRLLIDSKKDIEILRGVYGETVAKKPTKSKKRR